MFQRSKQAQSGEEVYLESQPGVGRLGPDPGLSLVRGAGSQLLNLLNCLGAGVQEAYLSASSRAWAQAGGLLWADWAPDSSRLHTLPCLVPGRSPRRAQSLTPWSICPAYRAQCLRVRPCHSWWVVPKGEEVWDLEPGAHQARVCATVVNWSFSRTALELSLHWG